MKSGVKTSEFWVTVFASVGAILAAGAEVVPGEWAAVIVAASTAAYSFSRGLAKERVVRDR